MSFDDLFHTNAPTATPLYLVRKSQLNNDLKAIPEALHAVVLANILHDQSVVMAQHNEQMVAVARVGKASEPYALSALPKVLPPQDYVLQDVSHIGLDESQAVLGWALGGYAFQRYLSQPRKMARLFVDQTASAQALHEAEAIALVRDLVNTPTEDMGPDHLEQAAHALAKQYNAAFSSIRGDDLLTNNHPTIHAVGRASHRAPRLIELEWGNDTHPHLILCGKGVCFDSGGLDMKSAAGMRWMKKDMGGAAHVLGLARIIMGMALPVRLTVLIPAVENSVAGDALRPGDVVTTRSGKTVEIHNTDAEGRLVLCDALAYAHERKPALIIDFATLTGAARIAMGQDLPPMFSNDDGISAALFAMSQKHNDPVWPMPLWQPYMSLLSSDIADISNCGSTPKAGCITAALYLQQFVGDTPWVHFDVYAWRDDNQAGRPKGGEAYALRTVTAFLQEVFLVEGK